MHCIIKEGREKMRDLNIITVSGTVNREPAYKENKENPNRTILYYSIEIYTGRDYYPDKEKKQLVHEKIYLNCVNYGKTAMELVNKVKKGSYVQVSGELRPNNYDREDGKVYGLQIMANTCIPEVNQQQSAGNSSNRTSNSNQQNSQSNTGKNASTQRSNNSGRKNSERSNQQPSSSNNEFAGLAPEENPFNMAAVKDDEFHNPYGDGNLPDPNDFMQNGDN